MPNKSPARILRDVKRITKFVSQKRPKPSLSITFVNRIEIPPIPKPKLSLSKIVCIEFPPVPKSSSNDNNEELKKQNDQLKHDVNVLNFILQSYKKDETNQDDVKPEVNKHFEETRQESFKCDYCYFEHASFEQMKRHRKTFHNEDFSLL